MAPHYRPHMKAIRPLIFLALTLAACGGGRWRPNTPHEVQLGDPRATFEATVAILRGRGYAILEMDPPRGFIRAQSMLDGDTRVVGGFGYVGLQQRISHIIFQVQSNGRLVVTAVGYHVREDVIHYRLVEEIDGLVQAIAASVPHA
jgi:hypothetical protein